MKVAEALAEEITNGEEVGAAIAIDIGGDSSSTSGAATPTPQTASRT